MSGYWEFYEETARAVSFDVSGRISHKFAGVKKLPLRSHERDARWIDAVEEVVWPSLYRWHYLRERRKASDRREGLTMREREDPEFVARLLDADRSAGLLDRGWRVAARGPDECLCEKGGLQLRVSAAALEAEGVHPGDETVAVRFPAGRRYSMPLYYCTAGGFAAEADLRIYFNVKPACAAWLLRVLSQDLHAAGASYQLKLLNHPRSYTRPDAAVLYVPVSAARVSRAIVDQLAGASAFRGAIPALTRGIYPGIAVADEPTPLRGGRRASFGEHRCRLLARGLARAHAEGCGSVTQAVTAISREFILANLDPSRPYASPGDRGAAAEF
ncbi:MAG: T3SS effector HopA1 family protein [Bryobacteraceae bacterium]|jgi:hypothetical protein